MPQGSHRMIEKHPGSGVSHHLPDPLLHLRFVAVYLAESARAFVRFERTTFQPLPAICQQFLARRAQLFVAFFFPAIEPDHLLYNFLLIFYTR
jgi:hypothetical protein